MLLGSDESPLRSAAEGGSAHGDRSEMERRLVRLEWKTNVLLALVAVVVIQPFIGVAIAGLKYAAILLGLIAVCLFLAFFRHRIPDWSRAAWSRLLDGGRDAAPTSGSPAEPASEPQQRSA